MTALNAAAILAAEDLKLEKVAIPEWGGDVYVRTMTSQMRDAFEADGIDARGEKGGSSAGMVGIRARLAAYTLCDEHGDLVFDEKPGGGPSSEQVAALQARSSVALDRIFVVASRLNHMRKEDIDELLGNSSGAPSAKPGSD